MSISQQLLLGAVDAHKSGRTEEAWRLYRLLLVVDPSHPDGLHLLGLIEKQLNRTDCALPLMRQALHVEPYLQGARHNLRRTLQSGGDHVGSERLLRQLVALDPADAEGLFALGVSLMRQARPGGIAAALCRHAAAESSGGPHPAERSADEHPHLSGC